MSSSSTWCSREWIRACFQMGNSSLSAMVILHVDGSAIVEQRASYERNTRYVLSFYQNEGSAAESIRLRSRVLNCP